jgi:hypothetical protein
MYALRHWSVRHARALERTYALVERVLIGLAPVFAKLGFERVEPAVTATERSVKTLLFDCKMCGQCILSDTGMSCPMNCPKQLRNGPCGGVRENGNCEVIPAMRCVWVEAVDGAARIPGGSEKLALAQHAVDRRLQGHSAWLRVVQEKTAPPP